MRTREVDAVIIGAGITGLVTAFLLRQKGLKILLVEKNDRVGGQIHTVCEDGFIFESGPNTGVVSNAEVVELFNQLTTDCALEVARKEAKVRLIWKNHAFHALPSGLIDAVSTPLFTWKDKVGILFEPFRAKGTDSFESIASLTRRRLGRSFLNYAVDPFISGIYAGNPEKLITRFALPKLYNLEHNYGSFIRGAIKKAKEPKSDRDKLPTKEVFSTPKGFSTLVEALAYRIGNDNIRLSADLSIATSSQGWETTLLTSQELVRSRFVISTVAAYSLPSLFPFIESKELSPISSLNYAPVIQIGVGIKENNGKVPNAFGGLIPSCEKQRMLGILFPSSCFANRSPKGGGVLSFFIGGSKHPEYLSYTDSQLIELVNDSLHRMLNFPLNFSPDKIRIFRHNKAIPQYEADSELRLAAIDQIQHKYSGLILGGGIRDGIGLADRIKQATNIAANVAKLS